MLKGKKLLIGVFAALVSAGAAFSAPVTIDYWGGWTGPDLDTMKSIVDKYNASQSNVQVNFQSLQWTPLFSKFLMEMKGGNPPDILAMHPFELGNFVELGVLDANIVKKLGLTKDEFVDIGWNGSFYNGVQYGVPLDVHMHGLFANMDLLAKAGVKSVPKTGEELIAAGIKLTVDKNGKHPGEAGFDADNIVQYGLGFAQNHHTFYQFFALMYQQNANFLTEDMSKVTIDEQKAVKALTWLQDLVLKYKIVPKGEKSPVDDFMAGKVAMFIDGPWQLGKVVTAPFKWTSNPYPRVFSNGSVWGAAEIFTFPNKGKSDPAKQRAVADFMRWMGANSVLWAKSGQLPASKAGLEAAKDLPGRAAFIESLPNERLLPPHPMAIQLFSASAPSPILTMSQDLLLNGKAPIDVVRQLEKDLDAILAQQ
ncbi:MAG: extracellular solute-binding protein [Treponema sp.]|nr:extracellular solute-binding protein [Treponema sp.]